MKNVYVLGIITCILFEGHVYDVNWRDVLAINSIGGHGTTGETFAAYMDLSAPVTSYNSHKQVIVCSQRRLQWNQNRKLLRKPNHM